MARKLPAAAFALILAATSAGAPAWAAKKEKGPARAKPPVSFPVARGVGLRGPERATVEPTPPVVVAATPAPSLPDLNAPRTPALRRLGQGEGAFATASLLGLRAHTDPAPLCRSSCARARYQCLAADGATNCDDTWGRCVLACRSPLAP